jgi:ChrR Cupin-like domain
MSAMSDRDALESLYSLNPDEIAALPWEPVAGCTGVDAKNLWRLGDFVVALIRCQPGATTPGEPHLVAHHHIWVVAGTATIAGRALSAGSYVHVPPGARHAICDVGPGGCTVLQMHRPHPPREAELLAARD